MTQDARRTVRQQLESWRLAGLTHLHRVPIVALSAPSVTEAAENTELSQSPVAATESLPAMSAELPTQTLFREVIETPVKSATATASLPAKLPLADCVRQLQVLNERVAACTRCDELARTRTKTVFGVGDPNARILFIGEAPGADEDKQGEPFVGRAGQLLTKIIEACRLKRSDVYICNILKCRPPENRTPLPDECTNCREYLDGQLAIIQPEYIVCWGTVAAQNLLRVETSIGKMRGRFYQHGSAKVLCTYHPSYLLRNPAAKKDVWEDMKFLFKDMGVELSPS